VAFLFSQKLIDETIKCFKEENGISISPEQANEYLDSFSGLFCAFSSKENKKNLDADAFASRRDSNSVSPSNNLLGSG